MYKFQAFNEFTLARFAGNELCCNNYMAFNDPFECWCIERNGFPDPVKEHDRFIDVIVAWGFEKDRQEEALENYEMLVEDLEDRAITIQPTIERARISCFCKDADNLLMWSHYGNGLRGFCVEFDEAALIESLTEPIEILTVSYQESPPVVDTAVWAVAEDQIWYHEMALEENPNDGCEEGYRQALIEARNLYRDLYIKTLATKPKVWEYENEMRLIFAPVTGDNPFYFKYNVSAIKSIILGEKMPDVQKEVLRNLVIAKSTNIPIKIAKRARSTYEVIIE